MAIFQKQHFGTSSVREVILPVVIFAALILMLWGGLNHISQNTREEQLRTAQQAVRRAAVQCYALEGSYPPDLNYLEQHYGLIIDHNRYLVHYQSLGSNLMPQIAVFALGEEDSSQTMEELGTFAGEE